MMKRINFFIAVILFTISAYGQTRELLKIDWPAEYKWKIGSDQENEKQHMIEIIPGNETFENWSIIGTMISYKGARNVTMDIVLNLMYDEAKKHGDDPTLTPIERNDTAENAWVLFKIEAPHYKHIKNPESQLFYVIQGHSSLYSNFVAVKEESLSPGFVEKWTKVFKASQLVYD
jgi:hypothetical protein